MEFESKSSYSTGRVNDLSNWSRYAQDYSFFTFSLSIRRFSWFFFFLGRILLKFFFLVLIFEINSLDLYIIFL